MIELLLKTKIRHKFTIESEIRKSLFVLKVKAKHEDMCTITKSPPLNHSQFNFSQFYKFLTKNRTRIRVRNTVYLD
jgi:hypothetical protein